jgi:hypothetical protein
MDELFMFYLYGGESCLSKSKRILYRALLGNVSHSSQSFKIFAKLHINKINETPRHTDPYIVKWSFLSLN